MIELVTEVPTTAKKQKKSRKIILAHGEVTGHHHALQVADPADWWKEGAPVVEGNEKPSELAGALFVMLPNGGTVVHQEHAAITLPAGTFRVTRQREYTPDAIRNVAD